jgi:beta-phosphoglucomutase-like phosphatase (HAD superfamily)
MAPSPTPCPCTGTRGAWCRSGTASTSPKSASTRWAGLSYDHHAVSVEKEHAFLPFIPNVKGIPEVVAIAREHHGKLPMAVASGGKKRVVEQVLQHLGIHHWFGAIVTSEDVTRQKPEPDIFLEAARRLGVEPQFCRGYEDTDLGMDAIRAAGMEAVDIRAFVTGAR